MVPSQRIEHGMEQLLAIMKQLRDPSRGCPWDREQTFATIAPYTIEEAYEVADAIQRHDQTDLLEELGDLLFQVVYHAELAREKGWFEFTDVLDGISEKLTRRHPHVFGGEHIKDANEQSRAWEVHKDKERTAKENGQSSVLTGIPLAMPALTRAVKLQKRAARVGFDWPNIVGPLEKVAEELAETRQALEQGAAEKFGEEIGDLLFACCNVARHGNTDPEAALRSSNDKFEKRFHYIEDQLHSMGQRLDDATLEEMDRLWEQAKQDAE